MIKLKEGIVLIKGINKRIIEVNDTGSDYFEKVLFIVKDNNADLRNLKLEANKVVNTYFPKNDFVYKGGYLRKREKRRKSVVVLLGFVILSAITGFIVLLKCY